MSNNNRLVVPPTRAEAAATELRRRILEGEYPGGMALRQAQIAAELGISRIPFREALVVLEAEGLVVTAPHRGASVVEISSAEVREQFEFRALLEPELLRLSAAHLTAEDFARLHEILNEYSEQLRCSNISLWGELNTELHSVLLRRANRPRMEQVASQLLRGTDRFVRMHLSFTDGRANAEHDHAEMVRLCEVGDLDAAAALMRTHILNAGQALVQVIEERSRADGGA